MDEQFGDQFTHLQKKIVLPISPLIFHIWNKDN